MAESDRQSGHNNGKRGFFAFKLHQFISGAGTAYATIDPPGHRTLTVNAQQFLPEQPEKRLYPVHFCRDCGQEYHPVFLELGRRRRCYRVRLTMYRRLSNAQKNQKARTGRSSAS